MAAFATPPPSAYSHPTTSGHRHLLVPFHRGLIASGAAALAVGLLVAGPAVEVAYAVTTPLNLPPAIQGPASSVATPAPTLQPAAVATPAPAVTLPEPIGSSLPAPVGSQPLPVSSPLPNANLPGPLGSVAPPQGSSSPPPSGTGTDPAAGVTQPAASAPPVAPTGTWSSTGGSRPTGSVAPRPSASGEPGRIPFLPLVVPASPLNLALLGAIAALPLLLGVWFLLVRRTWSAAKLQKDAGVRTELAGDIGVPADELKSLAPEALFKLREQVTFDELTGTLRRAAGIASVDREIARANRLKEPLSVAFLDVDGLKRINDSRGHSAGDALLKGVAKVLQERLRGQDLIFRFGGDEFVCVLPETSEGVAQETLERLQREARDKKLGFSFGVTCLQAGDDTVSLLGRADGNLYQAKQAATATPAIPLRKPKATVLT